MKAKKTVTDANLDQIVDIENFLIPEMSKREAAKGTANSLAILLTTIVLFFSTKLVSFKVADIVILILVLLFHETGHWLMMKAFGYRDVKMFFIPFFGAAVSGKGRKESAVKRCLVSLAGPLPGILLALLLYWLFSLTKDFLLLKTAKVLLALNLFNFLPLMPMDGGRYVDALFMERRGFRLFFSSLGILAFLAFGAVNLDIILVLVGLATLISAIGEFRLGGLTRRLAAEGIRPSSIAALLEDRPSLRRTLVGLYSTTPRAFEPEPIAAKIHNGLVSVVDNLRIKPARAAAKVSLLGLYLILLLGASVATFILIAADLQETMVTRQIEGQAVNFSQRSLFRELASEIPLDEKDLYHGRGLTFYDGKTELVAEEFWYDHGIRVGTWTDFSRQGLATRMEHYSQGRLTSLESIEDGVWKTMAAGELGFGPRLEEWILSHARPRKSLYQEFAQN